MSCEALRYGLLGANLSHSWSRELHTLLGNAAYQLIPCDGNALAEILTKRSFAGLNVTIPYKKAVLPYCDERSETVQKTGNANVLLLRDGKLVADNTDYRALRFHLRYAGITLRGEDVAILGGGGAATTAQALAKDSGAKSVTMVTRNGAVRFEETVKYRHATVLMQATPVGMFPHMDETPLSLDALPRCKAVLDLIYNPLRTRLLLQADARGIRHCNGLPMLAAQAVYTHELFLGEAVSETQLSWLIHTLSAQKQNLVLIGMPGAGKSTLAQLLAVKLGRKCLDSDTVFTQKHGITPADFLARYGESAFRREEGCILAELALRQGVVIATGGGSVLLPEAMQQLQNTGRIFWLQRALPLLPKENRPLSQNLEALYRERAALYTHYADARVENDCAPADVADKIYNMFTESNFPFDIL